MTVGIRTGGSNWTSYGPTLAKDLAVKGEQFTFIALASLSRAIVAYRSGKRNKATTDEFIQDLRERVDRRARDSDNIKTPSAMHSATGDLAALVDVAGSLPKALETGGSRSGGSGHVRKPPDLSDIVRR
jgi:hypothetical protein